MKVHAMVVETTVDVAASSVMLAAGSSDEETSPSLRGCPEEEGVH